MSDTAEDIQDGLAARATRGSGVSGGVVPSIESRDEFTSTHDNLEQPSEINSRLVEMLKSDLLACDVQLSLFVAACSSYRQDSALRPFPPMFMLDGERDIEGLLAAVQDLPSLAALLEMLEGGSVSLDKKSLNLVLWVLNGGPSRLNMRTLSQVEADEVLQLADTSKHPTPSHVLAVSTSLSGRWVAESQDQRTFWAFHGSRLDNFYSILNYGLQQHRTKVSLFGEGIYLSEDLGVCLTYSSRGVGWARSLLGNSVSCVALAQVIDHPSVKLHTDDTERGTVEGSEGGRVPDKYIVVRNNELLHIRYLLVYKHNVTSTRIRKNKFLQLVNDNRMVFLLVAYVGMLALIGLSKSVTVQRWLRRRGWIE